MLDYGIFMAFSFVINLVLFQVLIADTFGDDNFWDRSQGKKVLVKSENFFRDTFSL